MAQSLNDDIKTIEKLAKAEDFDMWKFHVLIIMKSENLYGLLDGSDELKETMSAEQKKEWHRSDAKAQRIILMSIAKEAKLHVTTCGTAYEMYKKLSAVYEKTQDQQKCTVLQEFFGLKYNKQDGLSVHVSKIQSIAFKLNNMKAGVDEAMVMSKILNTLPDEYRYFSSAWESATPSERTLDNLISRLLCEEVRINGETKVEHENVAFKATLTCFKCRKTGHIARNCNVGNKRTMGREDANQKGTSQGETKTNRCKICKKNNHLEADCYFNKNKTNKDNKGKLSFLVQKNPGVNFIIDSGATAHMVNDPQLLNKTRIICQRIGTANKHGKQMEAKLSGEVETNNCILNDVLYVPDLSRNLMSVSAMTDKNLEVRFKKGKVQVYKDNEVVLEGFKQQSGIYTVETSNIPEAMVSENTQDLELIHKKLGHLSFENIKSLSKMVDGLNIACDKFGKERRICDVCTRAKQTRTSFGSERGKAQRPIELIHTDVCGPMQCPTWDGNKYFVTFLDDFTHYTAVALIKGKHEVPIKLKEFIAEAETKWNSKVSKIRCDNGLEYNNTELKTWTKKRGTVIDFTTPYTPQLNGKAERLNRTLLEKVRALLFDSRLDKEMWGEALYVATYLTNRSPTAGLSITPAEMWFQRKPDLSGIQMFGAKAYAKCLTYTRKLDDRTNDYVFIGYGLNCYRLWDAKKRKIVLSRDVIVENKKSGVERKETEIKLDFSEDSEIDEDSNQIDDEEDELQLETEVTDNAPDENEEQPASNKDTTTEEVDKPTRPKRETRRPSRLNDFVYLTYDEALTGEEKSKWAEAIQEEKDSLTRNNTWTVVDMNKTNGAKLLNNKWVFKVKNNGTYKARLVVCGCEQEYGIDYTETYSPVVNINSLRVLFALAASRNSNIIGFDVKTAFLYGELSEEIYMKMPKGYEQKNQACKLNKSLYGLKQAPMKWNMKFTKFLNDNGLRETQSERCMFKNESGSIILVLYVDDGIIIDKTGIKKLLNSLTREFEVKINENLKTFIEIEVNETKEQIELTQRKYIEDVLKKFEMSDSKPFRTPIEKPRKGEENTDLEIKFPYREAVGCILYAANRTRPDISFATGFESRFVEKTKSIDIANVKRTLRYLNGTKNRGIAFKREQDEQLLQAYCDSDYAGDEDTRRSTTGYLILFCGGPISWCSRRQPIVALSSTEAEFIAAAECCKELLYLKGLITELTGKKVKTELNIDNQSTIKLIQKGIINKRSKHIDVRYKFITERIKSEEIEIKYCPTENQLADVFTKALNKVKFKQLVDSIMF